MSRDPSGIYSYPDGTRGVPDTTIFSARYNTFLDDLATTLNTKLPVNMGGTGGSTTVAARNSLDAEMAMQIVTNYDVHTWEAGSFRSEAGAISSPDGLGIPATGSYFGSVQVAGPDYVVVEARNINTGIKYMRTKIAGVWGNWAQEGMANIGTSSYFGSAAADMSYGLAGTSPNSYFFVNSESDASGNTIFGVYRAGPVIIRSPNSVFVIDSNDPLNSTDMYFQGAAEPRWLLRSETGTGNFRIGRFDAVGALADFPFNINWSTGFVSVSQDPASAMDVATKNYVDTTTMSATGDTMNGAFILNTDTVAVPLTVNAVNGGAAIALNNITGPPHAAAIIASSASQSRWALYLGDGTTEGGGNTGNDFKITRFADDGSVLANAVTINRATGNIQISNIVQHESGDGMPRYVFYNGGFAAPLGEVQCDGATSRMRFINWAAGGREIIFQANGGVQVGLGMNTRAGMSGASGGNNFNIEWTSTAQLWIDTSNLGTIAFTSDYRIKKDIADLDTTWEAVKALRPISYTQADHGSLFKADDVERWGFIAHELQETLIESAATGVKDDPVNIQSPNPWTVIAALTKALQEAMARIEALEAAA